MAVPDDVGDLSCGAGRDLETKSHRFFEKLRSGPHHAGIGPGPGTQALQSLGPPVPDPAVDRSPGITALGAVGMGVGCRRDGPHHHSLLRRAQPGVGRLGDHRPAVQGDGLGEVSVHLRLSLPGPVQGAGGMKRRLPITNQSGSLVVPRSLPPLTMLAKAHRATPATPARASPARHAPRIAPRASPTGWAPGLAALPGSPSSTARAAKPAPSAGARRENRRTQSRAVVWGTSAAPAAGRTPPEPSTTATITPPTALTPSRRPTRRNEGRRAWERRQGTHWPRATQAGAEMPPARTWRS